MRLEISQNLRRLRRGRGLSQERLGELLGVTTQSISHWECGVAYPDLETVPLLAGFFGVSTDELLGVAGTCAETRKEQYRRMLDASSGDERIALLRDARREFPRDLEFARLLCDALDSAGGYDNEILRTCFDALDVCTDGYLRAVFTEYIAVYESENDVYGFLDRVVTDRDTRSNKLLELRYDKRGERELWLSTSQFNTARDTETLLFRDPMKNEDPILRHRANLEYLNMISGVDEETRRRFPVLGDGVVDMWVDVRAYNGFCLGCRLAEAGDTDGALDALEQTAEVFARFRRLPDGAVLSYRTDIEGRLDVRVSTDADGVRRASFLHRVGIGRPGEPERLPVWHPDFGLHLFCDEDWHMYRRLGNLAHHPRYRACIGKIKG